MGLLSVYFAAIIFLYLSKVFIKFMPALIIIGVCAYLVPWYRRTRPDVINIEAIEDKILHEKLDRFLKSKYPEMVFSLKGNIWTIPTNGFIQVSSYKGGFYKGDKKILYRNGEFYSKEEENTPTVSSAAAWLEKHHADVIAANDEAVARKSTRFFVPCGIKDIDKVLEIFEKEGFQNVSAKEGKIIADTFFVE